MVPSISVVIPTLNAARTLALALQSLREQSISADEVEVIVADGGSTDDTAAIAESFGAKVIPNPRVLPWAGLLEGFKVARGRYAVMQGADEVILLRTAFESKLRLMAECPKVHSCLTAGLLNPKGYPSIGEYTNRCGDPFTYFMYRVDGGNYLESLRRTYAIERETNTDVVFRWDETLPAPLCDGGAHFFRLDRLRTLADFDDPKTISLVSDLLAKEHRRIAIVKGDYIEHHSSTTYQSIAAKMRWRVVGNIHQPDQAGFSAKQGGQPRAFNLKRFLFPLYAVSPLGAPLDAVRLAVQMRNPAMLAHAPLAVAAVAEIAKQLTLKTLGMRTKLGTYAAAK
jgi:glycosyltransferase involved in cell wall biosynthesis